MTPDDLYGSGFGMRERLAGAGDDVQPAKGIDVIHSTGARAAHLRCDELRGDGNTFGRRLVYDRQNRRFSSRQSPMIVAPPRHGSGIQSRGQNLEREARDGKRDPDNGDDDQGADHARTR